MLPASWERRTGRCGYGKRRRKGPVGSVDQAEASTDAAEGVPFDLAGMFQLSGKKAGKLFLNPATGQKQH